MPVIPVNKVVDEKRMIGQRGDEDEEQNLGPQSEKSSMDI
jgi:hypothetical protein